MKIFGATSGNGAEVDADNNLRVQVRPIATGPQGGAFQAIARVLPSTGIANNGPGSWTTNGGAFPFSHAPNSTNMVLLPNGMVFVPIANGTSTCNLFDPRGAGYWTTTSPLTHTTTGACSVLLPNGTVLIVTTTVGGSSTICCIYDPITGNVWQTGGIPSTNGSFTPVCLLPNGLVMAIGEVASGSSPVFLYDYLTEVWVAAPNNVGSPCNQASMTVISPTEALLVQGNGSSNTFLLNINSMTFTATGNLSATIASPVTCMLPNGLVLVWGFNSSNYNLYTPALGTWAAFTGPMGGSSNGPAPLCLLPNGFVLGIEGTAAYLYKIATNTWASTGSLPSGAQSVMAILLQEGQVLAGNNDGANTTSYLYTPNFSTITPAGQSDVLSLYWNNPSKLCLIRKVRAQVLTEGSVATRVDLLAFFARNYTVPDSGPGAVAGVPQVNASQYTNSSNATSPSVALVPRVVPGSNQVRTSLQPSLMGDLRFAQGGVLQTGAYVMDALPLARAQGFASAGAAALHVFGAGTDGTGFVNLVDRPPGTHPVVLAQNEGIIIQVRTEQPGNNLSVNMLFEIEWEEVPSY